MKNGVLFLCLFACCLEARADCIAVYTDPSRCAPCRQMEPAINALIAQGYDLRVVNTGQTPSPHIRIIPTFIWFDANNRELARHEGGMTSETLREFCRPAARQQGAPKAGGEVNMQKTWADPTIVRVRNSLPASPEGHPQFSYGTGAVIRVDGQCKYVVTCGHNTAGVGDPVRVYFNNGQEQQAICREYIRVADGGGTIDLSKDSDGAILELASPWSTGLELATSEPRPGEPLKAIGFPEDQPLRVRSVSMVQMNEANFEINQPSMEGESGSPVVNSRGQLCGVVYAYTPERSVCTRVTVVQGLLNKLFPNRRGAVIPRGTLVPVVPAVLPGQPAAQPGCDCGERFNAIDERLAALEARPCPVIPEGVATLADITEATAEQSTIYEGRFEEAGKLADQRLQQVKQDAIEAAKAAAGTLATQVKQDVLGKIGSAAGAHATSLPGWLTGLIGVGAVTGPLGLVAAGATYFGVRTIKKHLRERIAGGPGSAAQQPFPA